MITVSLRLTLGALAALACGGEESKAEPPEAPAVRSLFGKIRDGIPAPGTLPPFAGAADPSWPLITWRGLNAIANHQDMTGIDAPHTPPELDEFSNPSLDHHAVRAIHDKLSKTAYKSAAAKELLAAPGFLVSRIDHAKPAELDVTGATRFFPGKVVGRVLRVAPDGAAICETPFSVTSSEFVNTGLVARSEGEASLKASLRSDLSERTRAAILSAVGR